ncbi:hypothetical protein HMPREF0083_01504 [Aneurinibacillus aneurinilyticus ATCC 12856]|uniref:Uncharacterized protein n=1 Tax=Aneurinibacillus aneurinilyticus ATCC 12856 TaxID=649747 RepID=U1X604_ANEAE|nr:hypothetical protein HMPREF0083_01504 [Aneurinibacillus aneurinilyticus ATCC 12856]
MVHTLVLIGCEVHGRRIDSLSIVETQCIQKYVSSPLLVLDRFQDK